MITEKKLKEIKACLLAVGAGELTPSQMGNGLCVAIEDLFRVRLCLGFKRETLHHWEHFSGSITFPIPGGAAAYLRGRLWEGEQGAYRREFALWLEKQITRESFMRLGEQSQDRTL